MSRIGEALLRRLVVSTRVVPGARAKTTVGDSWADYIRWQYDSSAALFAKYRNFDINGKRVLEIGCGTGGRSAYLASSGACEVVGIDINAAEIDIARELVPSIYPDVVGRCTYHVPSGNAPLDIGTFDLVVLVDCMEHVQSPPAMMKLAYAYTKPGGHFYFSSVGYYHYLGSHMPLIPFANVFFSDETIINVHRWQLSRPDYVPNRFDSDPPTARWDGIYDLRDRPGEHLNKLTIREMKRLVRYSPFSRSRLTVLGFGGRRKLFRVLDPLRHLPVVQEAYHSIVIADCQRDKV
jgi:SAM-dependent methyltransferase